MIVERTLAKYIEKSLVNDSKIVILLGARKTGKTKLSHGLLDKMEKNSAYQCR